MPAEELKKHILGWLFHDVKKQRHEDRYKLSSRESIRFRARICEKQSKQHLDFIKSCENIDATTVGKRDAVGATAIHIAYLLGKYDIGFELVQKFPEIAILPYADFLPEDEANEFDNYKPDYMPYAGENILHIAIINRKEAEVARLLTFFRESGRKDQLRILLSGYTSGEFFERDGNTYFGGFPLLFAACSNNKNIFDCVLEAYRFVKADKNESVVTNEKVLSAHLRHLQGRGFRTMIQKKMIEYAFSMITQHDPNNAMYLRDEWGNNALHLCVFHTLSTMYEHVKKMTGNHGGSTLELFNTGSIPSLKSGARSFREIYGPNIAQQGLSESLNIDCDSPITLLASRPLPSEDDADKREKEATKKTDMLKFLIHQMRATCWEYGPVGRFRLDLDGIECIYNHQLYFPTFPREKQLCGAIELLCQTNSYECFAVPEIKRIVNEKWQKGGKRLFRVQFWWHILYTFLLNILVALINVDPSANSPQGNIDLSVYFIIFLTLCGDFLYFSLMAQPHEHWEPFKHIIYRALSAALFIQICLFILFSQFLRVEVITGVVVASAYMGILLSLLRFLWRCFLAFLSYVENRTTIGGNRGYTGNNERPIWLFIIIRAVNAKVFFPAWRFVCRSILALVLHFDRFSRAEKDEQSVHVQVESFWRNCDRQTVLFFFDSLRGTYSTGSVMFGSATNFLSILCFAVHCVLATFMWWHPVSAAPTPLPATFSSPSLVPSLVCVSNATCECNLLSSGYNSDGPNAFSALYIFSKLSLALSAMFAWVRFYYYFVGSDFYKINRSVLSMFRVIRKEIVPNVMLLGVILAAFTSCMSVLLNDPSTTSDEEGFMWRASLWLWSFWALIKDAVDFENSLTYKIESSGVNSSLHLVHDIILTLFYSVVVLLMLNLVIASVGDTYKDGIDEMESLILMERYNIMSAMQSTMTAQERKTFRLKFAMVSSTRDDSNGHQLAIEYEETDETWRGETTT